MTENGNDPTASTVTQVFLVTHVRELPTGEEDLKFIGVYGSQSDAEQAVKRASLRPGFSDHPTGFFVQGYEVGRDHWTEGFVTLFSK